jgi:hypothetical protein
MSNAIAEENGLKLMAEFQTRSTKYNMKNNENNENNENHVKWINGKEQIANATEDELRRVLLTCDGNGVEFKALALDRLIEFSKQMSVKS